MTRKEIVLATLAAAEGKPFQPVHLQKALFLVDKIAPEVFSDRYAFAPYDYGPFDSNVYADAEQLKLVGLVRIETQPGNSYRSYSLTDAGDLAGKKALKKMDSRHAEQIKKISALVTSLSFRQLVGAIYKAFPETKVNSVFNG